MADLVGASRAGPGRHEAGRDPVNQRQNRRPEPLNAGRSRPGSACDDLEVLLWLTPAASAEVRARKGAWLRSLRFLLQAPFAAPNPFVRLGLPILPRRARDHGFTVTHPPSLSHYPSARSHRGRAGTVASTFESASKPRAAASEGRCLSLPRDSQDAASVATWARCYDHGWARRGNRALVGRPSEPRRQVSGACTP